VLTATGEKVEPQSCSNGIEATGMYSVKNTTENSAVFYYTAK